MFKTTELEKDLSVNVDPELKFSKYTEILKLIKNTRIDHMDGEMWKNMFIALVRPPAKI